MESIRSYLLSITAAAVICGILKGISGEKGTFGAMLHMISGLFLAFTIISPLADIQLRELSLYTDEVYTDAIAAADQGEDYAQSAMAQRIKEESEAYILDKAAACGAQIQAEVLLSQQLRPEGSIITGQLSPYLRNQLEQLLEEELGIPKENQQWRN